MKKLEIREYPAGVLKKKAGTVKKFGPELESLVERLVLRGLYAHGVESGEGAI